MCFFIELCTMYRDSTCISFFKSMITGRLLITIELLGRSQYLCVQCVTVLSLSLYLSQVRYQSKFNELASWLLLCGYYVLIESETGYTILSRHLWLEWIKYISFACNDLNKHVFTWWFIGCFRRGSLNRLKMSMCSIYKYAQRINFKNTHTQCYNTPLRNVEYRGTRTIKEGIK